MRIPAEKSAPPKTRRFAKFLSFVLLFIFLGLSWRAGEQLYQEYLMHHTQAQLTDLYRLNCKAAESEPEKDWSNGMLAINPDYVGWLTVYGTEIDGPVVQGEDNDEYLRTDFYGNHSVAGVFFMDSLADMDVDGNLMIYGHMMYNETMFGPLRNYTNEDFFKKNNILRWEDKNGEHFYQLVAGIVLPGTADDMNYIDFRQWIGKQSKTTTKRMMEIVEENAYIFQPDLMRDGSEKYMFLMTCMRMDGSNRLLLVAERMDYDNGRLINNESVD